MKVVAFIEPPQGAVIEKILRHCGLWHPSTPRAPPSEDAWGYDPDGDWNNQPISSEQSGELTYVDIDGSYGNPIINWCVALTAAEQQQAGQA